MSKQLVTIYTVRRSPRTAAAKNSAGYSQPEYQFVATSEADAVNQAVAACRWRDPRDNFWFTVLGSRVEVLDS